MFWTVLCRCASVSQQHPRETVRHSVSPTATGSPYSTADPTGSGQRHGGDPHMTPWHLEKIIIHNDWLVDRSIRQTRQHVNHSGSSSNLQVWLQWGLQCYLSIVKYQSTSMTHVSVCTRTVVTRFVGYVNTFKVHFPASISKQDSQ